MFMVCVGLVLGSKNVQFHIICSYYYSISVNTTKVDPHSDFLHNGIVRFDNHNQEYSNVILRKFDDKQKTYKIKNRTQTLYHMYLNYLINTWPDRE